ncbi:hypothetical protein UlMin_008910 [Ulmus minor]
MLANNSPSSFPSSEPFSCLETGSNNNKRKRRPAGTPDPDAEVVSLSPKTLLESDRYVCEICNQGFQRDQNLQMHRRRHKVPWKLLKRETAVVKKRVFVCPEPSCLHHDPCHALGDLVGIKKHFRRKHSNHKQWVCEKCSKAYAVQSDYKAHLKTCGTRGHSCDCGRVFSRVESFIEHQDTCNMGGLRPSESQALQQACLSRTASSPSPSTDTNFSNPISPHWPPNLVLPIPISSSTTANLDQNPRFHNLELQLSTITSNPNLDKRLDHDENHSTHLQLSIGSSDFGDNKNECSSNSGELASRLKEEAREQMKLAMAERVRAEEARQEAKHHMELAEQEFANAKRIRQQAEMELDKAKAIKDRAIKQINSTILQITCHACKQLFHARITTSRPPPSQNSLLAFSYSLRKEYDLESHIPTDIMEKSTNL